LVIVVSGLVACAPNSTPVPTPEPKGGNGEFRVVIAGEPASLNPDLRTDDNAFNVGQSLFNKLVTLDADYRVIPDLATRWEISSDDLTYTFYLAPNVKWHDDQPCTSADVKWTLEAIAQQKGYAQDMAGRIAEITTPTITTVVVRLKEPFAPFISTLAWYGTFILPKHIYENTDWTKNPANEKPIGTGPFKFVEWVKDDHITATANKQYFRAGPWLDKVTWRFAKPTLTGMDLVLKGDADYTQSTPPRERVAELSKTPGISIKTYASTNRYFLGFNVSRKPLDDLRVRKAFNQIIDRSVVLSRAFAGLGTVGVGMYTPGIPWAYNPNALAPAYNLAEGKKLLDDAGLTPGADGTRLKLTLVTVNVSPAKETAAVVQAELAKAGVQLNMALVTTPEFDKRLYQEGDFDLTIADGSFGPDPDHLNTRFGSTNPNAYIRYSNAEFDTVIAQGARQTKLEDRAKSYFRAQEILARDLPWVPLVDPAFILMTRDTVTGLGYAEARGLVTFQNYSLVRLKR
jgi:peptide/nickel transport system substrate-binding protein